MIKVIRYLSENLYALVVVGVAISLIIFFILGTIKEKKELELMEMKRKEGEIKAPHSSKRFFQGEIIERQEFLDLEGTNEKMKNAIILCAGFGKRMHSTLPKGAVELLNKPMVMYQIEVLEKMKFDKVVVVVGHEKETIYKILEGHNVCFETQEVLNGTAKAVEAAKGSLLGYDGDTLILPVDMPLVSERLVNKVYEYHNLKNNDLTVLSTIVDNPFSYGRIVRDEDGNFTKIKEELDCTESEKAIKEINSGVYVVKNKLLFDALSKVKNENKKNEYYLTDIVEIMLNDGAKVEAFAYDDSLETTGINDMETLKVVEEELKKRINA